MIPLQQTGGRLQQMESGRRAISGPEFEVLNEGSCASLRVYMRKGDTLKAESNALICRSEHVTLAARMEGGFLKSLFRAAAGGESFFFQTLTAAADDSDVQLGSTFPGDVILASLNNSMELFIKQGSFLASEATVNIATVTQLSMSKALFGPGLFILQASGYGTLALHAYGSVTKYSLRHGERRSVDNGHVVAWSESMRYTVGLANRSAISSFASGEGMMFHFEGPGDIYVQSHNPAYIGPSARAGNNPNASAVPALFILMCFLCFFCVILTAVVGAASQAVVDPSGSVV